LGSCALNMCYVAAGRLDAYWATNVSVWDSAAGTVIAREAGAVLTAYTGSDFEDWNPRFCISASKPLHQSMISLLSQ
jgi:myo-inositol-1(or 4)-monophosphatase